MFSNSLLLFTGILLSTCFVQSANILGAFLMPSISHQVVFQAIWKELSLRGHKVTVLTPDPLNDPQLINLTEISVRQSYETFKKLRIHEIMSKDASPFSVFYNIYRVMDIITEEQFSNEQFQKIIQDKEETFDLILIEAFYPAFFGLAGRFKAPIISISSLGGIITHHESVGNTNHPVLYPDVLLNRGSGQLSLSEKIENFLYDIYCRLYYHHIVTPRAHEIATKYLGADIPYVGDLEKNVSMLFLNVNPILYPPRPTVPAIINLGQMHIKPAKPLPRDLQKILDQAREGVVYFSLGSNVNSVDIPEGTRNKIIKALSELPYTVLWKWESDHLPGQPKNVVIRKWLPQQDVLAHPNVKVFVTQGGLQSIEEAISRGVPLVGMPFMADQPMNVQKLEEIGIAIGINPETLTKDGLKNAIIEVAENVKYRNKMRAVQDLLNDQPMTGLERAVWWAEYVIRHKGASHLRAPTADISWFQYLLLDVIAAIIVAPVIVLYFLVKLLNRLQKQRVSNKKKIN